MKLLKLSLFAAATLALAGAAHADDVKPLTGNGVFSIGIEALSSMYWAGPVSPKKSSE